MKACARCQRIKIDEEWQNDKLPDWFFMVKPYRVYDWDICPECAMMRAGEMVTVCCNCFKLKNDAGQYVDVDFDHAYKNASYGICPECRNKLYPELEEAWN